LLNHKKISGFLASREEFSLGPETRLVCSELLCNRVYKSIKGIEKPSDIDIRMGQKEYQLASVSNGIIYSPVSYYSESKECLEVVKTSLDLLPQFTF